MTVQEIIDQLELEIVTAADCSREVTGGYTGDLLSNVMARAGTGNVWITIQGHQNVAAVALLTEVAAVIIAEGAPVAEQTVQRAREKGLNILRSQQPAFEIAGQLYRLGVNN